MAKTGSTLWGRGLQEVGNFNQVARTIPEWVDADGINTEFLQDFRGILLLRSEDGSLFAPIGIRFGKRGESLSAVPVIQVTTVPRSNPAIPYPRSPNNTPPACTERGQP